MTNKTHVVVEWNTGEYQIMANNPLVLKYLKKGKQIKFMSKPMTCEEAEALIVLYPKDKLIPVPWRTS